MQLAFFLIIVYDLILNALRNILGPLDPCDISQSKSRYTNACAPPDFVGTLCTNVH